MIDPDSPCPGCYHGGKLVKCGVFDEYGNGKHWFIIPVPGNENLTACDFCGGVAEGIEEEW